MDGRIVVVCAFEGEPLRRIVVNIGERLVYVANPERINTIQRGKSSPVGLSPDNVYTFDAQGYSALTAEWRETGKTRSWNLLRHLKMQEAAN